MKNLLVGILILIVSATVRADDWKDSEQLRQVANAWKLGDTVPKNLLKYHSSQDEGSCFPNPAGTDSIYYDITNYTLLKEIIFLKELDARVFTNAVNRALVLAGPKRFFQDVASTVKAKSELLNIEKFRALETQVSVKHIVVDSLYISYAEMPAERIKIVLNEIRQELIGGISWDEVYQKWSAKQEFSFQDKSGHGTRTHIGNLGDFVLPQNKSELFSYRENWMPEAHLAKLFAAHEADVLILFDKEDLSNYPDLAKTENGERLVLHRIREVWNGVPR